MVLKINENPKPGADGLSIDEMHRPLTPRALVLLWMVIGAGLRLFALPPTLGDLDAANFAAALERFDPAQQAPHWPGYPVYVLAARALAALGLDPLLALGGVGVLGFVAATPLLFAGLAHAFDRGTAHAVTAAVAVAPGAVLLAGRPGSEGLGVAFLLALVGAALLPERRAGVVGLLAGLGLGVRLSWWPLWLGAVIVSAWSAPRRNRARSLGLAVGVLVWLAPMLFLVGADALGGATEFATGHFTTWGGAMAPGADLGARLAAAGDAFAAGFGGALPFVVTAALAVVAWAVAPRRPSLEALALPAVTVVAYAVWILLAQNVERPRHALPLALAAIGGLAFLAHRGAPRWVSASIVAVLAIVSLDLANVQRAAPAPYARAATYIADIAAHEPVQVFAGRQGRLLERLVPGLRVWRPADPAVLAFEAEAARRRGATVLVLDDAPGADALGATNRVTFDGSPVLFGPDAVVTLYRYDSEVRRVASR